MHLRPTLLALQMSMIVLFATCEAFKNEQADTPSMWIEHASGVQCRPPVFQSEDDAASFLESKGIIVFDTSIRNTIVCHACGCPSGLIYQALIDSTKFSIADNLGWSRVVSP